MHWRTWPQQACWRPLQPLRRHRYAMVLLPAASCSFHRLELSQPSLFTAEGSLLAHALPLLVTPPAVCNLLVCQQTPLAAAAFVVVMLQVSFRWTWLSLSYLQAVRLYQLACRVSVSSTVQRWRLQACCTAQVLEVAQTPAVVSQFCFVPSACSFSPTAQSCFPVHTVGIYP